MKSGLRDTAPMYALLENATYKYFSSITIMRPFRVPEMTLNGFYNKGSVVGSPPACSSLNIRMPTGRGGLVRASRTVLQGYEPRSNDLTQREGFSYEV
jgi:hypothetical protein